LQIHPAAIFQPAPQAQFKKSLYDYFKKCGEGYVVVFTRSFDAYPPLELFCRKKYRADI